MLTIGSAQTPKPTAAQLEALETFIAKPTARVTWTKEVARIDAEPAHAAFTALIAEDAAQTPAKMRGLRIDLAGEGIKDQVYTAEDLLDRLIKALDEISIGLPRSLEHRGAPGGNHCFGSGIFWLQEGHAFNASACELGDWSGLSVSAGKQQTFRFTRVDAAAFASAIARARDELKKK